MTVSQWVGFGLFVIILIAVLDILMSDGADDFDSRRDVNGPDGV